MSYPQQQPVYVAPAPPKKKNTVWIVLGVIAGVLLIGCGGVVACTALVASSIDTPSSSGNGGGATVGLNEAVRDGKFEFTVHSVSCGQTQIGPERFGATAQGQFCLVELTVRNIGNEAQMFTGGNVYAFNAAGQKYEADTTAAIYLEGDARSFLENINPGNAVKGTVVFDIPANQTIATLELHDSIFSGGVTVKV